MAELLAKGLRGLLRALPHLIARDDHIVFVALAVDTNHAEVKLFYTHGRKMRRAYLEPKEGKPWASWIAKLRSSREARAELASRRQSDSSPRERSCSSADD